jgi:hypothetical protein
LSKDVAPISGACAVDGINRIVWSEVLCRWVQVNFVDRLADMIGRLYVTGLGTPVDLTNSNPFDVTSLLLHYIEVLPSPLIEFDTKTELDSIDLTRANV